MKLCQIALDHDKTKDIREEIERIKETSKNEIDAIMKKRREENDLMEATETVDDQADEIEEKKSDSKEAEK